MLYSIGYIYKLLFAYKRCIYVCFAYLYMLTWEGGWKQEPYGMGRSDNMGDGAGIFPAQHICCNLCIHAYSKKYLYVYVFCMFWIHVDEVCWKRLNGIEWSECRRDG